MKKLPKSIYLYRTKANPYAIFSWNKFTTSMMTILHFVYDTNQSSHPLKTAKLKEKLYKILVVDVPQPSKLTKKQMLNKIKQTQKILQQLNNYYPYFVWINLEIENNTSIF